MKNIIIFILLFLSAHISNAQWVQTSSEMGNRDVLSLIAKGNNLFAGTSNGIWKSTNNGENWTYININNSSIWSFAVNGNNLFAGGSNSGIWKSTDDGVTWNHTSQTNLWFWSLAGTGNNMYGGTYYNNGIYRSTDSGDNWSQVIQTGLDTCTVFSLTVDAENNIYAGTGFGGVFVSSDNGLTWIQTSLNNRSVYRLATKSSSEGTTIFAATNSASGLGSGVWKSTNYGANWTQCGNLVASVYSLSINADIVFGGTTCCGVWITNNNGANWAPKTEGMGNLFIRSLCILNNYLFAGTTTLGVYRRPLAEFIITGIQQISGDIPNNFSLSQNYPNPFNPSTKIRFSLPKTSFTNLVVYDVLGREIKTLVHELLSPGTYELEWSAERYPSGVYYYKILTDKFSETKKMILTK